MDTTTQFKFDYILDLVFYRKNDIESLSTNGIVNLSVLSESIKEYSEAKEKSEREFRLARREFSDLINGWVESGYGREIGYADVHQFVLS